jgi:hypothetical protein
MPPTAPTDCTVPKMTSLLPVRARTMGAATVKPSPAKRLAKKKTSWRPSRLGRLKM